MTQQLQENDLDALLTQYQQARHLLQNYPLLLDTILNQISALQSEQNNKSSRQAESETRRKPLTIRQSPIFYFEPVCPECGAVLITDPTDLDKLICSECSEDEG